MQHTGSQEELKSTTQSVHVESITIALYNEFVETEAALIHQILSSRLLHSNRLKGSSITPQAIIPPFFSLN